MFAITQKDFGGPETLEWAKVADPRPEPGEVIIDITATALNRADLLQRQGNYPTSPPAPPTFSDLNAREQSFPSALLSPWTESVTGSPHYLMVADTPRKWQFPWVKS